MADSTSTDIVDLKIDAENLAIDDINETIDGLSKLGDAARSTEKQLEKLEITQETIQSFNRVQDEVRQLRLEVDAAELSYEKMSAALKVNKNATDEEALAVKQAKRELADLRAELKGQESEYRRVSKSLKEYGVDTKDLSAAQQQVQREITETSEASAKLNAEYREQAATIRARIAVEKEAISVALAARAAEEAKQQEIAQVAAEQEKLIEQSRRISAAEAEQARQQQESAARLRQYEIQLRSMNDELDKSVLSKADYIRQEERLRQQLQLTEGQTKTIRSSLQAEIQQRKAVEASVREQRIEQDKLAQAQREALRRTVETVNAERAAAAELERVERAVVEYERELARLNAEKRDGILATGDYIRKEVELRNNLRLNEAQVRNSRRAIEADAKSKSDSVRNTDLLTQATRRLAQVYTVLLASQKAVEGVAQSVGEYGKLDAAITKVEKTTGIARQQVEQMADQLNILANEITPTATTELLRYAEVAGQLGTKSTADILNLAVAADALERSTNLAGDEAVELLARILTMTGEGIPSIQNLSSVIVGLGNDFAASEAQIAQMTKEIVSGTREINLGSAASAAYGATLAELGQPTERSRTAIQRLSSVIKEAAVNGGRDLQRLSNITKLSGDQIVESLGTEPEKVLLAFLEGLNEVNEAGGQMSKVLNSVGIDGTEALSVLGILAGGTERLKDALALANREFIAGDGHIKEAIKSYADQESALGRLSNQFTTLKKEIGEAFSPDTDAAIRATGDVITETTDRVVSLMEVLPELIVGLGEGLGAITELVTGLTDDDEGLGALDYIINIVKASFNGLTGTIKVVGIESRNLAIAVLESYHALADLAGFDIPTTTIDKLRESISILQKDVDRDVNDINNAWARMNGESSIAYEKFIETTREYGAAVSQLTVEQQTLINSIIQRNQYSAEENSLYRELTAAVIRSNREIEIETQIKAQLAITTEQANAAKRTEAEANVAVADSQAAINESLNLYIERAATVRQAIDDIIVKRNEGLLTDLEAVEATSILTGLLSTYNLEIQKQSESLGLNTATLAQNRESRIALFEAYQAGELSEAQFISQISALTEQSSLATNELGSLSSATRNSSQVLAEYAKRILDAERKIEDYKNELRNTTLVEADALKIKAALAVEEQKLITLKSEQVKFAQIENANYQQLNVLQQQYERQLRAITTAFERGALTKAEYERQIQAVKAALQEINSVIAENTNLTDQNTESTEKNAAAKGKTADAVKEVTSAMSLELSAGSFLNKQYDFTNSTVDALNKRYRELQSNIVQNSRVTSEWWRNLALTSNEVFRQERAAIQAEIAQRKLSGQIKETTFAELLLAKQTKQATDNIDELANTGLDPLLDDIEEAKRELQSLTETVQDTLDDVQDRLDRVLGNEQEIVKRQFQRELDELLALQDSAKAAGDLALVRKVEEALRKLREAQQLEYQKEFGEALGGTTPRRNTRAPIGQQTTVTTPTGTTVPDTSGTEPKAVLVLQVGNNKYSAEMGSSSLSRLMGDVEREQRLT